MSGPTHFRRVGIVGQDRDPALERVSRSLNGLAAERGLQLYPEDPLQDLFDGAGDFVPGEFDLLLSLGGDGTLLRGVGVNLGRLGFLTSVRPDELETAIQALDDGRYWLDTRFTLSARVVCRDGSISADYVALNDAVLHKGGFARVIRLALFVGEEREEVGEYSADGIILATPTGSTAYSLSAGGAIVAPSMECLLATPISPHTLAIRPLILPADQRVEVEIREPSTEVMLTIDGQEGEALVNGDRLVVSRGEATVPLVRLHGQSFFSTLRRKLHWGAGGSDRAAADVVAADGPEVSSGH
ncbi:MAG: NAD(+)/NADH kinase [Gemmatimonadota bacterium]